LGAAIAVVLVVLGLIGNGILSSKTGPEAAAISYINAVASGDEAATWNLLNVDRSNFNSTPSATLSQASLGVALQAQGNLHPSNVRATAQGGNMGSSVSVTVEYSDARGNHTAHLTMIKDSSSHSYVFYPSWKVQFTPASVAITAPSGLGTLKVDGQSVDVTSSGPTYVSLLPGDNPVSAIDTGLYTDTNATVPVAADGSPQQATVALKATLNPTALASAHKVVQDLFAHCKQTSSSQLESCPQNASTPCCGTITVTWSLLGDPSAGMVVQPSNAQASNAGSGSSSGAPSFDAYGTFIMIATWPNDNDTGHPSQSLSSGVYDAPMTWDGAHFIATGASMYTGSGSPVTVNEPAAITHVQVLQTVSAGFAACAADSSSAPSNCPMSNTDCQTNAQWTLVGNPTDPSTTQATFDAASISYNVTGAYTMSYTTLGGMCSGYFGNATGTDSTNYSAQVAWDGSKLQLVAIAPA
jgi:hypothetical protein